MVKVEDEYQRYARWFNDSVAKRDDSRQSLLEQTLVINEEVGELSEAVVTGDEVAIKAEAADVLVTVFLLAEQMDFNLHEAYCNKMEYNLTKSGRLQGGKIMDDGGDNE